MEITEEQKAVLSEEQIKKLQSTSPPAIDPEAIARAVAQTMQSHNQNQALDVMWSEKVTQMDKNGFGEWLNQEDDYGNVRLDQLNNIEDYSTRIEKLNRLNSSYQQAVAETGGRSPVIDNKVMELAKTNQQRYDNVDKKLRNGEIDSVHKLEQEWFQAVSQELDSIEK